MYNQDITFRAREDKPGPGGVLHDVYSRSAGNHDNSEDFQISEWITLYYIHYKPLCMY